MRFAIAFVATLVALGSSTAAAQACTADFDSSFTCPSTSVSFTDMTTSSSEAITGHSWEFGDGASSTQTNPTHDYASGGPYNVCLTASTSNGRSCMTCRSINIDCDQPDAGPDDGGPEDAAVDDAGPQDAGETDAGETDAGETDAGETDAGLTDAGLTDAEVQDAASTDAAAPDAGNAADAGEADAAATPDSGVDDSGAEDAGDAPGPDAAIGDADIPLDAPMTPVDASDQDAADTDADTDPGTGEGTDGCGCRAGDNSAGGQLSLLLLGMAVWSRRRRRSRV